MAARVLPINDEFEQHIERVHYHYEVISRKQQKLNVQMWRYFQLW